MDVDELIELLQKVARREAAVETANGEIISGVEVRHDLGEDHVIVVLKS